MLNIVLENMLKEKDLVKLSKYAEKLGVKKEVMDYVEVFYE